MFNLKITNMKKTLLVLLCMISAIALNAQTSKSTNYVYGVDYTHAKVFAADESIADFTKAFEGINMLLLSESDKYDFTRVLGKTANIVIEPIMKITAIADYDNMMTLSNIYDEPNTAEIVKNYELPQTEGTGIVMIAKFLDKPNARATYDIVVFDIATRKILQEKEVIGEAGGFGLRNYWARTVYNIIEKTKLYK